MRVNRLRFAHDHDRGGGAVTPERQAQLRRLCNEATEGPWELHIGTGQIRGPFGEIAKMRATCVTDLWESDAKLLAASRSAIPECLDRIAELERLLADKEAKR